MILSKEQYDALPEHLQKHIRPVTDWVGFKTSLKPAHEPIVMARKPFKGSTIDNVLKNGLGAMNIDATRVPWADDKDIVVKNEFDDGSKARSLNFGSSINAKKKSGQPQAGSRTKTFGTEIGASGVSGGEKEEGRECNNGGRYPSNVIGEVEEGYQNYFYNPKVSRKERHIGFEMQEALTGHIKGCYAEDGSRMAVGLDAAQGLTATNIGNNHPTVKPVALMDYLIKLVTPPSTPELQRKVLDPFMGSGSTGMAATALGHHFTGCELDPKYVAIAETRIDAWLKPDDDEPQLPSELFGT